MEALLDAGASVNANDKDGLTGNVDGCTWIRGNL